VADYYQLIARAVAGLDKNTDDSRRMLYEQSRKVLLAELEALDPPLKRSEIMRERQSLENTISRVEAAVRSPVGFLTEDRGGLSRRISRGLDRDVPSYAALAASTGQSSGPSEFNKGLALGTVMYAIGRIAIVVTFIVSGVLGLIDLGGTEAMIASKALPWPEPLAGVVASIEATVRSSFTQILAIAGPALEIVAGLLIAVGIFTRSAALALIIFTAISVYYLPNFWDLPNTERSDQLIRALNELSIMGALLILIAPGKRALGAGDDKSVGTPGEDLTNILRRLNSDHNSMSRRI
jgi:uncharacterized membrane protein YphA (DoxX/SURF4 family)